MTTYNPDRLRWAVLETLKLELPTYLAAQLADSNAYLPPTEELAAPPGAEPWVRNWRRLADFRALDASQSPSIVVTTPGLATEPQRDEDGNFRATWSVMVYVVVREQSWERTAAKVGLYVAGIRECLMVERLGAAGDSLWDWKAEGYNEIGEPDDTRTIGAGVVEFEVTLADVLTDMPLTGPEADSALVTTKPLIEGL